MEFRNGVLLQLIECIESTQNEVKRKMIETVARNVAPKSLRAPSKKKFCAIIEFYIPDRCRKQVGGRRQLF
jgi:hypothetical protein